MSNFCPFHISKSNLVDIETHWPLPQATYKGKKQVPLLWTENLDLGQFSKNGFDITFEVLHLSRYTEG